MTTALRATGFAPVARADARVLILGSLPGVPSLRAQQYYANPRNVFWRIMQDLLQISLDLPYAERVAALLERRVGLWDVLQSSQRAGSLDAAIKRVDANPNDFMQFFRTHSQLRLIAFNGKTAAQLFARLQFQVGDAGLPLQTSLPSTSPAHAAMSYADKLRHWSVVREALCD